MEDIKDLKSFARNSVQVQVLLAALKTNMQYVYNLICKTSTKETIVSAFFNYEKALLEANNKNEFLSKVNYSYYEIIEEVGTNKENIINKLRVLRKLEPNEVYDFLYEKINDNTIFIYLNAKYIIIKTIIN